ncbi:MAG: IbrB-like domain-containing protein [Barnesiella sp.]
MSELINYKSPVYQVQAVPVEKVRANSYNPNVVAPPEMKLLELSIWEDGFTMPCVCYYVPEEDMYELVDGFHRYTVMKKSKRIYEREQGLLPVVVIDKDLSNRMASTIRHNRARGSHNIELMSEIVSELTKSGISDEWIMKNIGMDADELLRLKQISGLAELFADKEFTIPVYRRKGRLSSENKNVHDLLYLKIKQERLWKKLNKKPLRY